MNKRKYVRKNTIKKVNKKTKRGKFNKKQIKTKRFRKKGMIRKMNNISRKKKSMWITVGGVDTDTISPEELMPLLGEREAGAEEAGAEEAGAEEALAEAREAADAATAEMEKARVDMKTKWRAEWTAFESLRDAQRRLNRAEWRAGWKRMTNSANAEEAAEDVVNAKAEVAENKAAHAEAKQVRDAAVKVWKAAGVKEGEAWKKVTAAARAAAARSR